MKKEKKKRKKKESVRGIPDSLAPVGRKAMALEPARGQRFGGAGTDRFSRLPQPDFDLENLARHPRSWCPRC